MKLLRISVFATLLLVASARSIYEEETSAEMMFEENVMFNAPEDVAAIQKRCIAKYSKLTQDQWTPEVQASFKKECGKYLRRASPPPQAKACLEKAKKIKNWTPEVEKSFDKECGKYVKRVRATPAKTKDVETADQILVEENVMFNAPEDVAAIQKRCIAKYSKLTQDQWTPEVQASFKKECGKYLRRASPPPQAKACLEKARKIKNWTPEVEKTFDKECGKYVKRVRATPAKTKDVETADQILVEENVMFNAPEGAALTQKQCFSKYLTGMKKWTPEMQASFKKECGNYFKLAKTTDGETLTSMYNADVDIDAWNKKTDECVSKLDKLPEGKKEEFAKWKKECDKYVQVVEPTVVEPTKAKPTKA